MQENTSQLQSRVDDLEKYTLVQDKFIMEGESRIQKLENAQHHWSRVGRVHDLQDQLHALQTKVSSGSHTDDSGCSIL